MVKSWMKQKPKIANVMFPETIGFKSPPEDMFEAMMAEPASPNPRVSKAPIF